MEKIKISVKREDGNLFKIDARLGGARTRYTCKCNQQEIVEIQKQLLFINQSPELLNVNEELVLDDFKMRIYKSYGLDSNIKNEFLESTISETIQVLKNLLKKKKMERKSLVNEFLNNSKNGFDIFIRMLFLGQFGVGKSTIIKKLSDIPNQVDFPVVDTARTTISDAHYIFKDKDKYSNFGFSVDFKTTQELFRLVSECYIRAIDRIFAGIEEGKEKNEIEDKAMVDFVTDPDKIFKIEYVLGKFYKTTNKKRYLADKFDQVCFWSEIYETIYRLIAGYLETEITGFEMSNSKGVLIEKTIRDKFLKSRGSGEKVEELIWDLVNKLENKMEIISKELECEGKGTCVYDGEELIGFMNNSYDIDKIDEYITVFSSTNIKNFTKIITPLVNSIAIEVPFNSQLTSKSKEQVICITDTVGFEHRKTDDTKSLEGSTNYSYNNYDIVGVIDSAKQSMNGTTENILREVYSNADKSKMMIMYTFFDEFVKKDFEDDDDKEEFLKDLQRTTIKKLDSSSTVDKFIKSLVEKTYFLSGLMNDINCVEELVKSVQKHFDNLYDYKQFEIIDAKKQLMTFSYRRLALVFNKTQEEYLSQQRYLYLQNYPGYKTTEALTGRLKNGYTYFSGANRTLKPIDDFCSILMDKIDKFVRNPDAINFVKKETIQNHEEKVIDWFKEEVSSSIKVLVKQIFVDIRYFTWKRLYEDWGTGVDYRRRMGIINEFNAILPDLIIDETTFADRWISEIEELFDKVLNEMKMQNL